jgi:hypothetical protein
MKKKPEGWWKINKYVGPHTCGNAIFGDGKHRQLTSTFIAHRCYDAIKATPTMPAGSLVHFVKLIFHYHIKYGAIGAHSFASMPSSTTYHTEWRGSLGSFRLRLQRTSLLRLSCTSKNLDIVLILLSLTATLFSLFAASQLFFVGLIEEGTRLLLIGNITIGTT